MYSMQKLLEMIAGDKSSVRYDACEWLRVRTESSPKIIFALQKAAYDSDPEVATRAKLALLTDVHHKQALQMGLAAPDERDLPAENQLESTSTEDTPISKAKDEYLTMLNKISSWGIWSLIWGGISFLVSGVFSAPWGVLLIIVGLASFYYRTASMFIIYGVTLAWAAIQNLTQFTVTWILFSLLQTYAMVSVFLNYRRFHRAEAEVLEKGAGPAAVSLSANRAARFFPWIGAILSCLSFLGILFGFILVIIMAYERGGTAFVPQYVYYIIEFIINMGVLGFAIGLASITSRYRPIIFGLLALIAGALALLLDLGLFLLNRAT